MTRFWTIVRCIPQAERACWRRADRLDQDLALVDLVDDVVEHRHRQRALGALDGQRAFFRLVAVTPPGMATGFLPMRDIQNTSARTSPPTFCSRASASDSTPRGVETITVPRPLRMCGSSRAPE